MKRDKVAMVGVIMEGLHRWYPLAGAKKCLTPMVETRIGGSRSWRNNNPGNLEYGKFAKQHGAIGTDALQCSLIKPRVMPQVALLREVRRPPSPV